MKKFIMSAMVGALLASGSALAHHSFAMFDQTKIVTLKGTVVEFDWTNPHSWIQLAVPNAKGDSKTWKIEMTSPNILARQGWKRTTLHTGDKVSVDINPLRDGNSGGLFLGVTLPDGKVIDSGLPRNGKPITMMDQ
jgi:hypothetical protein